MLLAALELARVAVEEGRAEADRLDSPVAVAAYLGPSMRNLPDESFRVLLLDPDCRLLNEMAVGPHRLTGGSGAVCLRDVFRVGIVNGAHGLVLVQNRPGAEPSPGDSDHQLTRAFRDGCMALGLAPLDHVILAGSAFYSASAAGVLPGWQ